MRLKEIGKSAIFSPSPRHCSAAEAPVGSRIFPTPPLTGPPHLLLAGTDRTQQIRIEETYTAMTMKLARKVIWDSQFDFFLLIQGFIVEIHTL
jgi:hypothetical protein